MSTHFDGIIKILVRIVFLNFVLIVFCQAQEPSSHRETLFLHKQKIFDNSLNKIVKSAAPGQSDFDAKYYKLELEISFNPNKITGKVSGLFQSTVNNLQELVLDLDGEMNVSGVSGAAQSYNHANQLLTLSLDRVYSNGELFDVTVEYSGTPDPANQRWIVFDKLIDGSDHLWTLSEPYGARLWWPCKDTPSDKADSVDIIVTAPFNQIVASNGTLISTTENGLETKTWHWHEKYPITTYLVSLAIAPYAHFTDTYISPENKEMLLDFYVYPEREAAARLIFPEVKDHLDAMIHYFGPYPFEDEKYGLAQFGGSGGMEHQTLTSVGQVNEQWRYLYVHELGHQWFGDALTCASWQDIWLNEGFASYTEALYAQWAGYSGEAPGIRAYQKYISEQIFLDPGTIFIQDTTDYRNIFNRIVYDKGSWILHMLRHIMGEEDFFKALFTYANHPDLKYTSVRTEDFKNVCEDISGMDLENFFNQWLYYPLFPKYTYKWEESGLSIAGEIGINVTISQQPADVVYEMPLDLRFTFPDAPDTTVKIWNNQITQFYTFQFSQRPIDMQFDPENWLLKVAREIPTGSFTKEIIIRNIYPNPAKEEINLIVQSWFQGNMSVDIFDINGRSVVSLKPYYSSGITEYFFKWDGSDKFGNSVASGIYFARARQNGKISERAKKMVIVK